jgi:hypothetical protein
MYAAKTKKGQKKWLRYELEIIRDNYLAMSDEQISVLLEGKRNPESVKTMRIKLGYTSRQGKDWVFN